ncbi:MULTISPECIES: hypothetical protein [Rhodomicrobium]|uniref:hypothetical protein n=1 Tax=Rhodomicrobium TaxID=1068 RepID=UPI000F74AFF4|nr:MULTISPECIES: hypothetical protein [Rhodomicrobium]
MEENAWALALFSYSVPPPGAEGFGQFFDLALSTFQDLGIKPTYFAADGPQDTGDLVPFSGAAQIRLSQAGFAGIRTLAVVANPEGSKQPGYDAFAHIGLAHIANISESLLTLSIEERFADFGGPQFKRILASLVALQKWDFGYALCQPIKKKPLFHVLGLDDGKLTPAESKLLNAWYASSPSDRVRKLRDVYPFYLVNDQQLAAKVGGGTSLREFIQEDRGSTLQSLDDSDLRLWSVDSASLAEVRAKLVFSDVLIR